MHKYTKTQIHKNTNTQKHKYTKTQTTNTAVHYQRYEKGAASDGLWRMTMQRGPVGTNGNSD